MTTTNLNIAIVGCGEISHSYVKTILPRKNLHLLGATDLIPERRDQFGQQYGVRIYETLSKLLADERIDVVVDLSSQKSHAEVVELSLKAGKHVHAEKPLALTYKDAKRLVDLATEKGLRLSCSPITVMSEAQQTVWKAVRDGMLGVIRVAYAEANWSRVENWHQNPEPFYQVGALYDVGVYPLALLTTLFGPAIQVTAYGAMLKPERQTQDGRSFRLEIPDFIIAMIEMASGTIVRLSANFYIGWHNKQKGIEFHGDLGSLHISSWERFDARVEFARFDQSYTEVPLLKEPYAGIDWGRALVELAEAMSYGRQHRASAEQAAHIIEILEATMHSASENKPIKISSTFSPPKPMEWASD